MLTPGTRLGRYEIHTLLGQGGMGEVYRARDVKLQREVALKVLPSDVGHDAARIERFSREATVLAALNHRNIAAIYGLLDDADPPALVMELVEGDSLADLLSRGPLPVRDALPIAKQIAEALEAAHAQGIVHRDLKPANVKVRPDREVKVLDFGIAKALEPRPPHAASESATLTAPTPLTGTGVILGTGPYMSPEQARGGSVDRRTDMWAFGVVLWEMLTGQQLFAGSTLSDSIAAILHNEPDWSTLPAQVPAPVHRLLHRCLQKDRAARLDSALVARLEIDDAMSTRESGAVAPRGRVWVPWLVTATLGVALVIVSLRSMSTPQRAALPPVQVSAELGIDVPLRKDFGPAAIVSPNGQTLVYASAATTVPALLYVRRMEQLSAMELRGTENATNPFFSPDGRWVGFFADGKLKKIALTGGPATTLCDAPSGRGGTWGADDTIVFSPDNAPKTVLLRVSADGGSPQPLSALGPGELSHRWPQVLPGNRGVIYTANTSDNWDDASIVVQPLPSGAAKVVQSGFFARYVESGHLLYVKGGTLYAAPFDLTALAVTGPPVVVTDRIVADATTGGAQFAVSTAGTLVFLRGAAFTPSAPAAWMDRGGTVAPLRSEPLDWGNPQFSPDGTQLAFDVRDGKQTDVWVQQLATSKLSRLTFDRADDYKPIWTPDGQRIVFTSTRDGVPNLYWQRADGTGDAERLHASPDAQSAGSWHPSGGVLAFQETRRDGSDIMLLPMTIASPTKWKAGAPTVFVGGPFNQTEPVFSPDGRWVAYTSNETGRAEIFVRAFDGDGKWQVSLGGGRDATWSRTRSELIYFSTTLDRLMVAPFVVNGGSFRADATRAWSVTPVGRPARSGRTFAMHPDGERVVIVPSTATTADHLTLIFGLFEQLRGMAATPQ